MQLDLLNIDELTQLRQLISSSQNIVVIGHKAPDGDAIGSCLAWAEYLRTQGKKATVVVPDAYPAFLCWMPGTEKIVRHDKHPEKVQKAFTEADTIFCLDFGETSRIEDAEPLLVNSQANIVVIDHHIGPNIPAALTISLPEACSTAELVFRLINQLGGFEAMDYKQAAPIYCGMMTDTGGFTYNSTRPEIYQIIGLLLTKKIDKDKIYRQVFNNYSHWAIRLRGYIMNQKLNYIDDLHCAYYSVSRQDMLNYHFIKGDMEGLVNEPLRIKGVKLSISLREDDRRDNTILVSLRSVDDFPCNKMAADFFNGGGHLNASGGKLNCSLAEAEEITRKAIKAYEKLLR